MLDASRTITVPAALRLAARRGVDIAKIARELSLPRGIEARTHIVLPVRVQGEVFEALAAATGDPLFGAALSASHPRGELGLAEYLFRTAPTIRDAFQTVCRFSIMANNALQIALMTTPRTLGIETAMSLGRQWNEWLIGFFVYRLRESVPASALARMALRFAHASHPQQRELERAFGVAAIEFGARANGLVLPREAGVRALAGADPRLHALLVEHAERDAMFRERETPFVSTVREQIEHQLRERLPTLAQVARSLAMSSRSLQRRLASERTSVQQIVSSVRAQLARELLRAGGSVLEVALALHYSDASAFARAFRRETGITPARFRGEREDGDR